LVDDELYNKFILVQFIPEGLREIDVGERGGFEEHRSDIGRVIACYATANG
jgi:hypothetical protein